MGCIGLQLGCIGLALARLSAKARSLDAAAAKKRRKYAILRPKACCDEDGDSDPDHSDESGSSSYSSHKGTLILLL